VLHGCPNDGQVRLRGTKRPQYLYTTCPTTPAHTHMRLGQREINRKSPRKIIIWFSVTLLYYNNIIMYSNRKSKMLFFCCACAYCTRGRVVAVIRRTIIILYFINIQCYNIYTITIETIYYCQKIRQLDGGGWVTARD